jgi:hypothetical protein
MGSILVLEKHYISYKVAGQDKQIFPCVHILRCLFVGHNLCFNLFFIDPMRNYVILSPLFLGEVN